MSTTDFFQKQHIQLWLYIYKKHKKHKYQLY